MQRPSMFRLTLWFKMEKYGSLSVRIKRVCRDLALPIGLFLPQPVQQVRSVPMGRKVLEDPRDLKVQRDFKGCKVSRDLRGHRD